MARVIVLDAGILIAFLSARDVHHDAVTAFLVDRSGERYVASVVTIAEALVHPTRQKRAAAAAASLRSLGLTEVSVPADSAVALAEVREVTRLRMPDAIVLHTAEIAGATLATTDGAVARAARQRGVLVHDLGVG